MDCLVNDRPLFLQHISKNEPPEEEKPGDGHQGRKIVVEDDAGLTADKVGDQDHQSDTQDVQNESSENADGNRLKPG